jgi:hypothetical protein
VVLTIPVTNDAEEYRNYAPGNIYPGRIYLDSSDLELCRENWDGQTDLHYQYVGLRFQDIMVPPGASIQHAYITFVKDDSERYTLGTDRAVSLTMRGQYVGDAPVFSTQDYNLSTRASEMVGTPSIVTWEIAANEWKPQETGTEDSADISPIIQDIVDLGSWDFGNAIAINLFSEMTEKAGVRVAYSKNKGENYAPKLTIEYTLQGPPSLNDPVRATPGSTQQPTPAPLTTYIGSFTLVDADTTKDIRKLNDGDVLILSDLPNINIRADVLGSGVRSCTFEIDGQFIRTENAFPWALGSNKDNNVDYLPWIPSKFGPQTVKATIYPQSDGSGSPIHSLSLAFTVWESPPPGSPAITGFTLINADTNSPIRELVEDDDLFLSGLPPNINIRADTVGTVGSVQFKIDGAEVKVENRAPYALAGDEPAGNYHPWTVGKFGRQAIQATLYSESGLNGSPVNSLEMNLWIWE